MVYPDGCFSKKKKEPKHVASAVNKKRFFSDKRGVN
jgi:hypothetical protein